MEKYHCFLISYDLKPGAEKSKRVIAWLRENNALPLTKSTWLVYGPNEDASYIYVALTEEMDDDPLYDIFGNRITGSTSDRLIVTEITGGVYYDNMLCDDRGRSRLAEILQKSESAKEGF